MSVELLASQSSSTIISLSNQHCVGGLSSKSPIFSHGKCLATPLVVWWDRHNGRLAVNSPLFGTYRIQFTHFIQPRHGTYVHENHDFRVNTYVFGMYLVATILARNA